MKYRKLGHSGQEISTLSLGTMMFGRWGNPDRDECRHMVHVALDAGVNFFDTADIYDFGTSEEFLGDALRGWRHEVVIGTKVGNAMSDDPAERGLSRRWILESCDNSLRRLGVDQIDVYQMHRPDPDTPFDETLEAFDRLVTAGKVRHIGTSTFSPEEIDEMARLAGGRGWVAPTSEQPPYSVLARGIETAVLPTCRRHDIGVVVWAPLNGGWLTGKYQQGTADADSRAQREPDHFDYRNGDIAETKRAMVDQLTTIASDHGLTLVQLALGFVLHDPAITAALIGPRTPSQLHDLLTAGHVDLGDDVITAIDSVVAPGLNVNPADAG
jgi:aryl-alcohol dehydrogenase-like predicted oxidoreductase